MIRWYLIAAVIILASIVAVIGTRYQPVRAATSFYYVGSWVWQSDMWTAPDPFISSFDLRSLPAQSVAGRDGEISCCAIFVTDSPSNQDWRLLGTSANPETPIDPKILDELAVQLAISPLTANTLQGVLYELVISKADPLGVSAWKPVKADSERIVKFSIADLEYERPATDGSIEWSNTVAIERETYAKAREESLAKSDDHYLKVLDALADKYDVDYRTFLGGLPDEGTKPHETAHFEDWDGCTTLSTDLTWDENFDGTDWNCDTVETNQAHILGAVGVDGAKADHNLSTTDQQGALTIVDWTVGSGNLNGGVICRKEDNTTATYYIARGWVSGGTQYDISKRIAGATTMLAAYFVLPVDGDSIVLRLDGSVLSLFVNGTLRIETTDTAITLGLQCGIFTQSTGGAANEIDVDNWSAQDYETVTPTPTSTPTFTPTPTPTFTPTATPTFTPTPTPTTVPPTVIPTATSVGGGAVGCSATMPNCVQITAWPELNINWWIPVFSALMFGFIVVSEWRKIPILYLAVAVFGIVLVPYLPSDRGIIVYMIPLVLVAWSFARIWMMVSTSRQGSVQV